MREVYIQENAVAFRRATYVAGLPESSKISAVRAEILVCAVRAGRTSGPHSEFADGRTQGIPAR